LAASPSALAYALVSDPMIVTHREHQPAVQSEATDSNDYSIFKRSVLEAVASDFGQPALRGFYLEGKGFVEIETVKRLILKSAQATLLDQQVTERHGLARGAPEIGGGIVRILIFDNAPQPWQPGGFGYIASSESFSPSSGAAGTGAGPS
jgi:hypothetical protein